MLQRIADKMFDSTIVHGMCACQACEWEELLRPLKDCTRLGIFWGKSCWKNSTFKYCFWERRKYALNTMTLILRNSELILLIKDRQWMPSDTWESLPFFDCFEKARTCNPQFRFFARRAFAIATSGLEVLVSQDFGFHGRDGYSELTYSLVRGKYWKFR